MHVATICAALGLGLGLGLLSGLPADAQSAPVKLIKSAKPVGPAARQAGPFGNMHQRLQALAGTWSVKKYIYMAGGTPDKPLVGTLNCRRTWIAGGRFLQDIMAGPMAALPGGQYYRMGVLGYSGIDKRYEWNTVDAFNSNMMTYKGKSGDARMNMVGEFTDAGVLGPANKGKVIAMRTVIQIDSRDQHTFLLYVTPPGRPEFLADRAVYTRQPAAAGR